jgi:hypothetical protein
MTVNLVKQYQYVNGLNVETKRVIGDYTGNEYEDLNYRLRNGATLSEEQMYMVKILDKAFISVPPLENPIIVYRGIKSNLISEILSYISTSQDIDQTKEFTGSQCCLLRITISAGSKILPIEYISEAKYEKEILLPRFGMLTITKQSYYGNTKMYDLVFLPAYSISITPETTKSEIDNILTDEEWSDRILSLIIPEELELFDSIEELITSIVESSFSNTTIPTTAITLAIEKFNISV